MAVGGSVLECSTPSFGYRLAIDLGGADLRRQTAEVSRPPTVPQRRSGRVGLPSAVPDAWLGRIFLDDLGDGAV